MLSHVLEVLDEARRCNHRRMIVLAGPREWGLKNLREIVENVDLERKIVFTWMPDFEMPCEIEELKNSEKYLGTNYDFLALDFHHSFVPNDLGKLVNVVKGGGLIVILAPRLEEWKKSVNYFHESILTPPYTMEDIRHNFIPWVIKKMFEHDGISINEEGRWIKKSSLSCPPRKERSVDDSALPEKLRKLCLTQEQVEVVKLGWKMENGSSLVLTADRGRGKSSALGILASLLIAKKKARRIGVTSPDFNNLTEFFRFLKMGLDRFGVKYEERKRGIHGKLFFLEYREPTAVEVKRYDLLVVDEAAGIPVPLLLQFSKTKRTIYSTTVHGYEGTGRSFAIRFLGELRKRKRSIVEVKMKEPIRYAEDDPVERWVFDTLLLDSEPADIGDVDLEKLEYRKYRIEDLLKNEEKLREFYGIFVLAHYRNNPNDFGIICDAPNQEIRTLEYDGHVVCSVQLAREGRIEDKAEDMYYGEVPPGNIVPDVVIKHYKNKEFASLSGLRIVRIATHPKLMDRGIGSKMLERISEEDVDWVGSSFGATFRLMRFWVKNGFHAIHVSPKVNEKTGEYSVVVIKPISKEAQRTVKGIRRMFGTRFLTTLGEIHSGMDVSLARILLQSIPRRGKIKLDDVDWKRLISYAWGPGNYEVTMDVIHEVAKQYFLAKKVPSLNREQEEILIGKALQHRTWKDAGREIGRGDIYVVIEMREIMRKFIGGKFDDEVLEFQRRFHGEDSER